jgi:hypothetical protein
MTSKAVRAASMTDDTANTPKGPIASQRASVIGMTATATKSTRSLT